MHSNEEKDDPVIDQLDRYIAAQDRPEPLDLGKLLTDADKIDDGRMVELLGTIVSLEEWSSQGDVGRVIGSDCSYELDGWRLRRVLGRGGSGIVFLGERDDGQSAAIKAILRADNHHHGRWQREVDIISRLEDPHIIPLVAAGESKGIAYVAMRFVDGASLADLIDWQRKRKGQGSAASDFPPLTKIDPVAKKAATESKLRTPQAHLFSALAGQRPYIRAALMTIADVAEALEAAHRAGVIHRDVKPSNVLVDRNGHVWLSDFGMASTQADVALTASGLTVGTLGYMSPEQAAGMSGDPRSDIYSLGVTALELLTLTAPLASLPWRSERQRWSGRRWARTTPQRARRILLKSISVDPQQRPSSAGEVARQLRWAAQESAWSTRHWLSICAAIILCLGMVRSLIGTSPWQRAFTAASAALAPNVDQEMADAMRKERIALLRTTSPKHSWEREVARNEARLSLRFEARDDQNRAIEKLTVGDYFWLVVRGDSEVKRDGNWQRAITFSIRGIMKAKPARRFQVLGGLEWATGYQALDEEFKFFEPVCVAGPISGVAVDKRLYGQELGQIAVQEPIVRLKCLAQSAGEVQIDFELPVSAAGNSNTIRHVPRRLFDEEVTSTPLTIEIVAKIDD